MAKGRLDLTSRVRQGMAVERLSADERLTQNNVVETAQREAARVTGAALALAPSMLARKGRFSIRLADLVSNPYNPRTFYNPQTIDSLAKSFSDEGQIDAIKITELPEYPNKRVIVDGERRVRAAKALGNEYIDAELSEEPLGAKDLYLRAYRANKERDEQTVFDDAVAWRKLLNEGVYVDYNELAAAVGESVNQVTKITLLNELPQLFFNKLAQAAKPLGLSHAYNLKLIYERAGEQVAEHWLQEIIEGRASVRRLEQAASADATIKRPGSRRPHYQSRVQFKTPTGADLGELKLFGDGRTELSLKGVQGPAQHKLADRVKALVEEWSLEINDDSDLSASGA
ncbi:ParB/RepB/Spo0J family partition protein [Paraburkholderia elongata]|uniref:ParB/RepB/Spo0J family partition protein n=1 Tax=Paraburkholderia elongata TaxID=2675747 RepID=A0A972NXA6_9BURK|nr:ParB/RepB/Spo0J family partition protein [Paraburkholderia elongata]NPT60841.1 ParB/RepB/Spo0J family partition protein [Paraburkholderia elongata]